jgi:hypothetical protein
VGLVHDHRIGAVGERVDLLGDVGELLQRRDDDAGLLAGERLGQLGGVLVDALHHAVHVLELVDVSCSCLSSTRRSVITTTLSNTFSSASLCSDDSRCASQAIVLLLPDPAEC